MAKRPSLFTTFALLVSLAMLAPGSATAGLVPVRTGDGVVTFDQPIQTTLAICQNDWVHLMTQVGYRARGNVRDVPRIGWVIALPEGAPTDTLADPDPLSTAWNWTTYLATVGDPTAELGIISSSWVDARCEMEILPGRRELLAWLAENDFGMLPEEPVRMYHDMGFVFAAVKIEPQPPGGRLPASGMLKALVASYRNRDLVLPSLLARENGSYHHVLFVASDLPVNPGDAEACGFATMTPEAAAERFDRIAWQAAAPESSRAFVQHLFATGELAAGVPAPTDTPRARDRELEWEGAWLADMLSGLRREVVNLPASFSGREREEFAPVPPVVADFYGKMIAPTSSEPMDLFLSAFCAPAMNMRDTEAELGFWTADPRIRLELSATPRPPLPSPSRLAVSEGDYAPPRRALLPLPDELVRLFDDFRSARTPHDIDRQAARILREARAFQQISFLRQIERAGGDSLTRTLPDTMRWPNREGAITNPRNMAAFERSFRRIKQQLTALRGVLVIKRRHAGGEAGPLLLVYRLHVTPRGSIDHASVTGNLPSDLRGVAERIVEESVLLPPADSAEWYDFLVVVR